MIRMSTAALVLVAIGPACSQPSPAPAPLPLPVETELLLLNLSRRWYAAFELRPAAGPDARSGGEFTIQKLIPPGGVLRTPFLALFPATGGCPDRLDLRVYLYKRANEDVPIGLDADEETDPSPVASGELLDVPACEFVVSSTYTISVRDSEEGAGVVKFPVYVDRASARTFSGTNLPDQPTVPELLDDAPLRGRVLAPNGTPVEGVGVAVRARFRVNDNDCDICPDDFQCRCYGPPIAVAGTDENGRFSLDRPPGAYLLEVGGDGFLFRPVTLEVESPIDNIIFIAEPQP